MRRDNGVHAALLVVGGLAALGSLLGPGARGSSFKRAPDGDGGVTFDLRKMLGRAEEEEPEEPPMCDIYILNADNVDGHFVERLLRQVFGMAMDAARRAGREAHENGRAHIGTMGCVEGRQKVEEAKTLARAEHPPAANIFLVVEKD